MRLRRSSLEMDSYLIWISKFPLIWLNLNDCSGVRTHYLENSTLVFIREIPLKILQISSKKKLAKYFDKNKIRFFFVFFFQKMSFCHSSKGTKNNEKNISSSFREIEKSLKKFSKKKWSMILAKYFEKKNIPIFFLRIFQKMCRNIYFRELKQLRKNM